MIQTLPEDQIERTLHEQFMGRLGCHADGRTYVVPIAYAYEDGYIYGHTAEGTKVRMMRKNPNVCFEVDCVDGVSNWHSVIAWGRYEELHGESARQALRVLLLRFLSTKTRALDYPLLRTRPGVTDDAGAIIYRIRLIEKTGRFQKSESY
jgi:nitroimidazol reductase NimA-like FMN-containing flavoprotein (pyridoxamine 5'-phosphate oxidase superfamily)